LRPVASAVEMREVTKRFGTVEALRGVSLEIEEGEVVAILGPNGAGKTTAINIMLGLRRPTSGTARLFGLEPSDRRARSRAGVMLQESGVHGALTVRELVDLFRSYYPNPMPAERAIALAGLEEQARVHSAKLSGGQRQRLYFALAVCGDPALLFLDEPTVGLDVEARRAFLAGIRGFAQEGRTIVLTTHYLEEADALAERIVVIDRGRVIADSSPHQIKSQVAARRVSFVTDHQLSSAELIGLPVIGVEVQAGRVRILTNEPEEVLRALFSRGLPIRELEVAGADLEEAFISLTGRHREVIA